MPKSFSTTSFFILVNVHKPATPDLSALTVPQFIRRSFACMYTAITAKHTAESSELLSQQNILVKVSQQNILVKVLNCSLSHSSKTSCNGVDLYLLNPKLTVRLTRPLSEVQEIVRAMNAQHGFWLQKIADSYKRYSQAIKQTSLLIASSICKYNIRESLECWNLLPNNYTIQKSL